MNCPTNPRKNQHKYQSTLRRSLHDAHYHKPLSSRRRCVEVCPVECMFQVSQFWVAMVLHRPWHMHRLRRLHSRMPIWSHFPRRRSPIFLTAKGSEYLNRVGIKGHYEGTNHHGEAVVLDSVKQLSAGEVLTWPKTIRRTTITSKKTGYTALEKYRIQANWSFLKNRYCASHFVRHRSLK